jgi:ribosomal protein L44E
MNEVLRECYNSHFSLTNKSDRKTILQLWSRTFEEQSLEDRNLILYGEKLITELRFESKIGPSREYERHRFDHRSDYEKVVLEGKCEMCGKNNVVIWPYIEYTRRIADLEADDLIRFACQECKNENSCVIRNF